MKNSKKNLVLWFMVIFVLVIVAIAAYFHRVNSSSYTEQPPITTDSDHKATLVKDGTRYQLSYGNTEDDQCLTLNSKNQNTNASPTTTRICAFTVDIPILSGGKRYSFTDPSLDLQDVTFSGLTVVGDTFFVKVDLDLGQSTTRSYSCILSDFSSTSALTCSDETETGDSNQNESISTFTDFARIKKYIISRDIAVPILVPQHLPKDFSLTNGDASLVADVTADDSGYNIVLRYGDCGDACSVLYMGGSKGEPNDVYDEKITLSNHIVGYYSSGPTEGTRSGLASIEWGYDGYVYAIQNYSKSFLVEMADSATADLK